MVLQLKGKQRTYVVANGSNVTLHIQRNLLISQLENQSSIQVVPTTNDYRDATPPAEATAGRFPRMESSFFNDVTCSSMLVEVKD